ncbi:DUF7541 family protein [Natronomonas amylolytica]|uniref:DUF7541 family protein n=1 Tax=Natronomonas amylolytica TaxID=3108498 RepID=UPI00300BADF5
MEAEPEPGISERYEKASAWPLVVVFGLVLSEIGILFNLYPVSVAGLIMFVGSVAGIVHEAGYVVRPWRLLSGLGVALVVVGMLIVSTQVDGGVSAYLSQAAVANQISQRGFTIGATGAVVAVAGVVLPRVLNQ